MLNNNRASALAAEITSTDYSRRMFEAVRSLADRNKSETICVKDPDGNIVLQKHCTTKAGIIRNYFEAQYSGDEPIDAFGGPPSPIDLPITSAEVMYAAKKL